MIAALALLAVTTLPPAAAAPPRSHRPLPESGPAPDALPRALLVPEGTDDACTLALETAAGAAGPDGAARLAGFGRGAVDGIVTAFATAPAGERMVMLLDALAATGDFREEALIRGLLYSEDARVAEAATHTLARIDGPRAAPTLEFVIRTNRPVGQTLLAIEELAALRMPATFPELARIAEDPARPEIVRAAAARHLPRIDAPRTRKWLERLKLAPGTSPFLRAEVDRLMASLAIQPPRDGRTPALR